MAAEAKAAAAAEPKSAGQKEEDKDSARKAADAASKHVAPQETDVQKLVKHGICPLVSHHWPPRRVYAPLSHTIGPHAGYMPPCLTPLAPTP
eukprot:422471-Prorocentrum_minimum.AAC.1